MRKPNLAKQLYALFIFACVICPFTIFPLPANGASTVPPPGTWTATGSLQTARSYHTATLLASGDVLAVGGFDENENPLSSCELYDPSTGTWTATGSLNSARLNHTATLLASGDVLAVGGDVNSDNGVLSSCE
ncbi:MAG: kelch repeat-containing protein, partial [Syntrophobacteraceae bacterium]